MVERGIPLVGAPFYRRYRYRLEGGNGGKFRRPLLADETGDAPVRIRNGSKR